jgi:hypothetical protein
MAPAASAMRQARADYSAALASENLDLMRSAERRIRAARLYKGK